MSHIDNQITATVGLAGGSVTDGDDGYLYPLSPKMIAFNVIPYDNNGDMSVQKWLPALDPAYHAVADSNNDNVAISVAQGVGILSILSKTYPFVNAIENISSGVIRFGLLLDANSWTYGRFLEGLNVVGLISATLPSSNVGMIHKTTHNIVTRSFTGSLTSQANFMGTTTSGLFFHFLLDQRFGASHFGDVTFGFEMADSSWSPSSGEIGYTGSYTTTEVREDATNVYVRVQGATSGNTYGTMNKSNGSWIIGVAVPGGRASATICTYGTAASQAVLLTNVDGFTYGSLGYAPDTAYNNTSLQTNISLSINGTILETKNYILNETTNDVNDEFVIPFTDLTATDPTVLEFELSTTNGQARPLKIGFGITGGQYNAPTLSQGTSGSATAGRDVSTNGSYLNVELADV